MPTESAAMATPISILLTERSRSVRSCAWAPPALKALAAMENEPMTIGRLRMIPKMPAVAIAPTPMKRT